MDKSFWISLKACNWLCLECFAVKYLINECLLHCNIYTIDRWTFIIKTWDWLVVIIFVHLLKIHRCLCFTLVLIFSVIYMCTVWSHGTATSIEDTYWTLAVILLKIRVDNSEQNHCLSKDTRVCERVSIPSCSTQFFAYTNKLGEVACPEVSSCFEWQRFTCCL